MKRPTPEQLPLMEIDLSRYDPEDPECLDEENLSRRYLLVEKSRYNGAHWLSTFDMPEEAAAYHDGQESEDWDVQVLIDRATGRELKPITETRFE